MFAHSSSRAKTHQLVHPWKLITKDFILGQYYRRGWEDLFNITRSCEGDKVLLPKDLLKILQHINMVLAHCPNAQVDEDPKEVATGVLNAQWAKKTCKGSVE